MAFGLSVGSGNTAAPVNLLNDTWQARRVHGKPAKKHPTFISA
jgi:hypothetical protein